jgi:protein SCO1/2
MNGNEPAVVERVGDAEQAEPTSSRPRPWLPAVVLLLAFGSIAAVVAVMGSLVWNLRREARLRGPIVVQPIAPASTEPRPLPDFSLIDQHGNPVTLADLKGKIWVADFFFTSCPAQCPMITSRLAELQKVLPEGADVKLVSITVDPERDSPEVLSEYAERFGAQDDRWLFLTGEKAAIIQLAREGFLLPAGENPNDHTLRLALVDRDGMIRGYFQSLDDKSLDELKQQIKLLAR